MVQVREAAVTCRLLRRRGVVGPFEPLPAEFPAAPRGPVARRFGLMVSVWNVRHHRIEVTNTDMPLSLYLSCLSLSFLRFLMRASFLPEIYLSICVSSHLGKYTVVP